MPVPFTSCAPPSMPVARHVPSIARPVRRTLRAILVTCALLALAGCQSNRPAPAATAVTPPPAAAPTLAEELAASFPEPAGETAPHAPVLPAAVDPADPAACCLRANLWDRIRAGFRFDLDEDNPRIAAQRAWYIRNQQYLDRVVARGARYMHYIVEEAESRDMPLELALLPVVESAFDPFAFSSAGAAGPWQFIASTGRFYDLRQDWWYDGRRDIPRSTAAALDYLESLAARFDGDYYKALASYNAGAGTISRAITRNLRAGLRTDYWSLKVPQETAAYVPKLIALAQIVKDPSKYGVHLNPVPDEPRFVRVELPAQIDLARAAELADIPLAELYLYNPAHSRWLTDPVGPHALLLPVELADAFRAAIAVPGVQFANMSRHEVVEGETLASIAEANDIPPEALRAMNRLPDDDVAPGTMITVPRPHLMLAAADLTYETRIVALNRPAPVRVRAGKPTGPVYYKVRRGDTISKVARAYRVSPRDLVRRNKLRMSRPLKVGQVLAIPGTGVAAGGGKAVAAKRQGKGGNVGNSGSGDRRVVHQVKRGETLFSLARRFKVSVHDIARWNDFSAKRQLRVGERVKLYVD